MDNSIKEPKEVYSKSTHDVLTENQFNAMSEMQKQSCEDVVIGKELLRFIEQ